MELATAVRETEAAALAAGRAYFRTKMHGRDGDCCGFAWVEVRPTSPDQRAALEAAGFTAADTGTKMTRTFDHGAATQGLSCKEAANEAAAVVLRRAGFPAQMRSMMD